MALDCGGQCDRVAFRLADDDRLAQIRPMINRELGTLRDADAIRWLTVDTEDGPVRALVFWAGPTGERVQRKIPLPKVAAILTRACGHAGSCAKYLYLTVRFWRRKAFAIAISSSCRGWSLMEIKRIHGMMSFRSMSSLI